MFSSVAHLEVPVGGVRHRSPLPPWSRRAAGSCLWCRGTQWVLLNHKCPRSAQKPLARACVKDHLVKSLEETNNTDQTHEGEAVQLQFGLICALVGRGGTAGLPPKMPPQQQWLGRLASRRGAESGTGPPATREVLGKLLCVCDRAPRFLLLHAPGCSAFAP